MRTNSLIAVICFIVMLNLTVYTAEKVKVVKDGDSYRVDTKVYSARIDKTGSLESLKIGKVEFINSGLKQNFKGKIITVPGVYASNFNAFTSPKVCYYLTKVKEFKGNRLKAVGDNWYLEYTFLPDTIELSCEGDPSPTQKGFSNYHPSVGLNFNLSNNITRCCDQEEQGEFGWPIKRKMEPGNFAVIADNGAGMIFEKTSRVISAVNKRKFPEKPHALHGLTFDWKSGYRPGKPMARKIKLFKKAGLDYSLTMKISSPNPLHMFPRGTPVVFPVEVKVLYGNSLNGSLVFDGSPYVWKKPKVKSSVPLKLSPSKPQKTIKLRIKPVKPGQYMGTIGIAVKGKTLYRQRICFMFEPERIPPAKPPADFDAFWDKTLADLEKVPLDMTMKHLKEEETAQRKVFKVKFRTWKGQWAYAWLYVPKKKGKFPAEVVCPPVSNYQPSMSHRSRSKLSIYVAVHGGDISTRPAKSDFDYMNTGIKSKDTYMFRHGFCCLVRCYDIIKNHPKCNGEVNIFGSSQGGGLALVLGGLRPDAKSIKTQLPAYIRPDWTILGHTRWGPRCPKGQDPKKIAKVVSYYGAANFTHRIKAPVQLAFGLFDYCGTAEGIFSGINALPKNVPCKVIIDPYGGHGSFNYGLLKEQKPSKVPQWEGSKKDNKLVR